METTRRAALHRRARRPCPGRPAPWPKRRHAALPQRPCPRRRAGTASSSAASPSPRCFDGFARRTTEGLVRNAPLPEVQATLAESFLPTATYDGPYTVTFVDTGQLLIAFDTGTGGQMAPTAGLLGANMAAAGIDPARVGLVVITHCHQDHIHGLTTRDGTAVFPNAEVAVAEPEWAWWSDAGNETRSPEGQRVNFANVARRFAPYRDRTRRFAPGAEVSPASMPWPPSAIRRAIASSASPMPGSS